MRVKNAILLLTVTFGLLLSAATTVNAATWDIVNLSTSVNATDIGLASSTIYYPTELIGHNYFAEYYVKALPADNNYWNKQTTDHCYPKSGGSGGFSSATSSLDLKASFHQTSNTAFSSPLCNVSGNYYVIFRDSTASSTILYVATYYYNATINQFFPGGDYQDNTCTTCSRILGTDPTYGENLGLAPQSADFEVSYYLTDYDYDDEGEVYITYDWYHALSPYNDEYPSGSYTSLPLSPTTNSIVSGYIGETLTYNGTYNVDIRMYRRITQPFWAFWRDDYDIQIDSLKTYFSLSTTTTETEIEDASRAATYTDSALMQQMDSMLNRLLHTPPIGYATIIVEMLNATSSASTTALSITHTFPTGQPGEGNVITLDIASGITEAISVINNTPVDTIDGSAFDTFMNYWNTLWYGALAFWIVAKVFGSFSYSLERETVVGGGAKPTNYKKTGGVKGVTGVTGTAYWGSNKQSLKRSQYKSYD